MSLPANLKKLESYHNKLHESKNSYVDVGVIASKLTKSVYKDGASVVQVAATHEFGAGDIPRRSFLQLPFDVKKKELNDFVKKQYALIFDDKTTVKTALGLVGIFARNASLEAFETGGFGKWAQLKPATIARKGSATILTETATLKQSINWEVKGASS